MKKLRYVLNELRSEFVWLRIILLFAVVIGLLSLSIWFFFIYGGADKIFSVTLWQIICLGIITLLLFAVSILGLIVIVFILVQIILYAVKAYQKAVALEKNESQKTADV